MAERIDCPACGAPLEYAPTDEVIQCAFCGAEFEVNQEEDQPGLRVRAQPEPQKQVLGLRDEEIAEETLRDESAEQGPETVQKAGGEGVNHGWYPENYGDERVVNEDASITRAAQAAETVPGTAAIYDVDRQQVGVPSGRRNRWVILGVSVVVIACIICLCAAGAVLALNANLQITP